MSTLDGYDVPPVGARVAFTPDSPYYGAGFRTGTVTRTDQTCRDFLLEQDGRYCEPPGTILGRMLEESPAMVETLGECWPVVRADPCATVMVAMLFGVHPMHFTVIAPGDDLRN